MCSTLELHKKSSVFFSFFFFGVVRFGGVLERGGGGHGSGGRGLHGVSEGGGGDLSSGLSQPGGKKLLSSLAERALMLRYRLPDGRSWKRLWEGWVGSFTMLLVLLEHRARKMSRMDGRGAPMIFAAVFTVRWRVLRSAALQFPYQTVIQLVSTLSMVPL